MYLIMNQIRAIYREEGKLSGLSSDERTAKRQLVVKPLVDAFFAYLKQNSDRVPKSGKTKEAFTYALNQDGICVYFLKMGMSRWIITPVNVPSADSVLARIML